MTCGGVTLPIVASSAISSAVAVRLPRRPGTPGRSNRRWLRLGRRDRSRFQQGLFAVNVNHRAVVATNGPGVTELLVELVVLVVVALVVVGLTIEVLVLPAIRPILGDLELGLQIGVLQPLLEELLLKPVPARRGTASCESSRPQARDQGRPCCGARSWRCRGLQPSDRSARTASWRRCPG